MPDQRSVGNFRPEWFSNYGVSWGSITKLLPRHHIGLVHTPFARRNHCLVGWCRMTGHRLWSLRNEGPFVWRTSRGYHMLVHCQLEPFRRTRGAYGYSKDGLSWTLLPDYSWETNMTWADGAVSYSLRRQSPGLY